MTEKPSSSSSPHTIREYVSPNGICFFSSGSGTKVVYRAEDSAFKLEMHLEHCGGDVRARLEFKPGYNLALKDSSWDDARSWSPLYAMFSVLAESEDSTVGFSSADIEHKIELAIAGDLHQFLRAQQNITSFNDMFGLSQD